MTTTEDRDMGGLRFLDDEAIKALELLKDKGLIPKEFNPNDEILQSVKIANS